MDMKIQVSVLLSVNYGIAHGLCSESSKIVIVIWDSCLGWEIRIFRAML